MKHIKVYKMSKLCKNCLSFYVVATNMDIAFKKARQIDKDIDTVQLVKNGDRINGFIVF